MKPLPEGVRLLHIGPFKTGTTTVQAALHQNREALAAQGVTYIGKGPHAMVAAMAATGRGLSTAGLDEGVRRWRRLVEQARDSQDRAVVFSSEFFSEADDDHARNILDDLGPRTHVVVTVRPLVRIMASQWQQYMQNRRDLTYDDSVDYEGWLDLILNHPEQRRVTPTFWGRHRHDRLIQRWADLVGADRLTVIVVDERDKGMLVRAFEQLLELASGSLEPRELGANRSLTLPEIATLRAFNAGYLAEGWGLPDYTRLLRFGAIRHLQQRTPEPGEPRLLTPQWAVDRTAEIGQEMAANIAASGVAVVGDLSLLGDPAVATSVGENDPIDAVSPSVAARLAAGFVGMLANVSPEDANEHRGDLVRHAQEMAAVLRAADSGSGLRDRLALAEDELADLRPRVEIGRGELAVRLAARLRNRLRGS